MNTSDNLFRFTPNVKMADAISRHHSLLTVLPRLSIPLGFGEKTIKQLCDENNVSLMLFMMIGKIHIQDNYHPDTEELEQCRMTDLTQYLQNSHNDYLCNKLPHIESHLNMFLGNIQERYATLIANFYKEFKDGVKKHFRYEEEVVFPYLNEISGCSKQRITKKGSSRSAINKQHDDIEDTIKDLTNLLLKYIPAEVLPTERIDMLMDMYSLADDIEKHAMMEDRILIPYIQMLESKKR